MSEEKDTYGFDFEDKYEEIIAAMQKKQEEEVIDIVSDSSLTKDTHGRFKKKERNNFKLWWKNLTKGKKAALISVTSVVLVIAILLSWFFIYFRYNYNAITSNPDKLGFSGVKDKSVINIALYGVDTRDENVFKGNTDSIMILSLNTKTKKVKIISVMRDTFVPMEYEGKKYYGKINSAYTKGPEHAIKTLNENFDLDISEYATVNFFGMVDIIDAVGGITATITEDELKWKGNDHPNLNNCMDEICSQMGLKASDYYIKKSGEQTLNGVQAVAYARVRNCTSTWGTRDDFGRTDRQRHVMQELFNKAITMKKTQYVSLIKALIPCTETSLSYADILSLAVNILLSSPTFEQYRLPPAEYQSDFLMTGPSGYGSIIYYDLGYAAKLVNAIIYDDVTMEEYIEENGIDHNDWYSGSSSSNTTKPSAVKPSYSETTSTDNTASNIITSDDNTTTGDGGSDKTDNKDDDKDNDKDNKTDGDTITGDDDKITDGDGSDKTDNKDDDKDNDKDNKTDGEQTPGDGDEDTDTPGETTPDETLKPDGDTAEEN